MLAILSLLGILAVLDEPGSKPVIDLKPWLVAGPLELPPVALAAKAEAEPKNPADALLEFDGIDASRLDPTADSSLDAFLQHATWRASDVVVFGSGNTTRVAYAFLAIECDRYVQATLAIKANHRFHAFVDGEKKLEKAKADPRDGTEASSTSGEISLEPGRHRLLIRSVFDPTGKDDWLFSATLTPKAGYEAAKIAVTQSPTRRLAVDDLLDASAISGVALSATGSFVAVSMRRPEVPADFSKRHLEIRDTATLEIVSTSESLTDLSGFTWLPSGDRYSYVTRDGEKATLWVRSAEGGPAQAVLRDVEKLGDYAWLPDGENVIYTRSLEEKPDDRGVKRMRGLTDRWAGQRDIGHLYLATAKPPYAARQIVGGELTAALADVRMDGRAILFTRIRNEILERPYSETELYELDLLTLASTKLLTARGLNSAQYSSDGRILLLGATSLDPGSLAAGSITNDYDAKAFVFDPSTRAIEPLIKDSVPSIEQLVVSPDRKTLYLRSERGLGVEVVEVDLATRIARTIALPFQVASGLAVSKAGNQLAAFGSTAGQPPRLAVLDPRDRTAAARTVVPESDRFATIRFGKTTRFDVELEPGRVIEGFVHEPVDFDPAQKYPAIVFYYGGVNPVAMEFGGRYPRDLWAAHGYVSYVLTPSGATGRGPEFAGKHVNDWGTRTGEEILACLERFLRDHPYVDEKRLGCIGASYGGFMTMSLLTKTARFKAAVAHAGISSISSYWGEGNWGFQYSAVASADSFPWNAREVYVDKSPLFHADKITTSLLLTHGEVDSNVPIGESEQMYTALKLLGKDVEFLKFAKQDHHILTYPVRKLWMKSILAWFDWKLKDQPAWWNELYPK